MYKLGLIGGGNWGKNLIREFNSLGVLKTICEINILLINQYKQLYPHINITNSFNEMLNDNDITAICISLPAEMHYEYSKRVLLANKDLFVEKPITLSIEHAEELLKLAKNKSRILMVGHLLHYHPAIKEIKNIINSKQLGNIKHIISNRLNLGIFRTEENVLWSLAPHDISIILSLCNNKLPNEVECLGHSVLTPGIHDITNTIFKIDDVYININVNWLNPYKEQKLTIICEKGMLLFDDMEQKNKLKLFKNHIQWSNDFKPKPNKRDAEIIELDLNKSPLELECEHFINCCKSRLQPITNGEEGLRVLQVLEMCSNKLNPKCNYYVHPTSIVDQGAKIQDKTKIWHWTHITSSAVIGSNCSIGQNCYIAGKLGSGCKVQNNVSVYKGVECEDNVFLGPSCVFTNDKNPRCEYPKNGEYIKTFINTGATIGANVTIVCGIKIGTYSLIGAGAVITKDVEPYSIMVGNPAKKIGVIDDKGNRTLF
jgi:UDP-2-acetamido-3-amino-2,3-dideoxy-glucuronate N-acetyltransferase